MPSEISLMVSTEGLTALADMALAPKNQSRLDDLLARNTEGVLAEVVAPSRASASQSPRAPFVWLCSAEGVQSNANLFLDRPGQPTCPK